MKIPEKVPEKGFYYHFKHDPTGPVNVYAYELLGLGIHSEDDSFLVNYLPLYQDARPYKATTELGIICCDTRPLEIWMGDVTKDGKTFPRFQKITDPKIISQLEEIKNQMYK